jgi:hypothetical protein
MSSLADLPEVVGFFSYSREDDEAFEGTLSALRDGIHRELSAQLGRSKAAFRLWQDRMAIAPGQLWESEIKTAVEQAVFFIPIVTPRAVNSHHCRFEFEAFLARELALDRNDLVFPLLYIGVPGLENEAQWRNDPVLSVIGTPQYVDWRALRHLDVHTTAVREATERFCEKIVGALRKPWVSPEERRKRQEIEARQRAEEEQRRVEAARQAEEEKRRAEAARQVEEEKQRAVVEWRLRDEARQTEHEKQRTEAAHQTWRAWREAEKQSAGTIRQAEEEQRRAEAAQQTEEEKRQAQAAQRPPYGEHEDSRIEFFYQRDFLIWARQELLEQFRVNSLAFSATRARQQLELRGYRVLWSVVDGFKVQRPPTRYS